MYSHTLWIEPGCKLLAFGFAQRSELSRKDGRHDMNKGMQLWGAEGLGTACESLQLCATSFCLALDPLPGNSVLVYHQICEKAFQYWWFFLIVCSEGFKRQTSSTSPSSAWQGGFLCWAPPSLSPGRALGTTSPVGQTQMHQKPCASSCDLCCGTTSALRCLPFLQLSESKNPLPWLELKSGCILLKINKLVHWVPWL